jgi:hypothetical protein
MAVIEKKSVSNKSSKVADKEKRKEVNYSDYDSYGSSFIDEDDS